MTPDELRQLTAESIRQAADERRQKEEAERLRAEKEQKEIEERAAKILLVFPEEAKNAAINGQHSVELMDLENADIENIPTGAVPTYGPRQSSFILSGKTKKSRIAQIVQRGLEKAGFSTSLTQWDDGVGIKGGWKLVVSWKI